MSSVSDSLLAFLVDRGREEDAADYPWLHPQWRQFPAAIREQLEHGRNFSEAIHGAALLYNFLLAEKSKKQELMKQYQADLKDWAENMSARADEFARWDQTRFWSIVKSHPTVRISSPAHQFVSTWLDLALSPAIASRIKSHEPARKLIQQREGSLKGNLARLKNRDALRLWNGAAGTGRLDYRWRQARIIINDILAGQKGSYA